MKALDFKSSGNSTDKTSNSQGTWPGYRGSFLTCCSDSDMARVWDIKETLMPSKTTYRNSLSPRMVTCFPLSPTWALSPAPLLPEHSGHQHPSWEPNLMLLIHSESSKCFLTTVKKISACSYFPDQISPRSISHHICMYHSAGFSFSTVEAVVDLSSPCHLFWSSSY